MIKFPNIDPVAFSILDFPVHWYGIAYAVGILLASYSAQKLCRIHRNTPINEKHIDGLFSYAVLGIILGGRLGYVLFYNPAYYLENPMEIIEIWNGGMSFHGGFLGVLLACLAYKARWDNLSFIYLTDRIAPGACLGLMLGRLANFINGELWGRPTDVAWAMEFPNAGAIPRHPSQLYEALFEGLILYIILYQIAKRTNRQGVVSGCFLIGYGISRFFIEFTRQPDDIEHLKEGIFQYITMGQILCLPMIGFGAYMLHKVYAKKRLIENSISNAYKEGADNNNSTKFNYGEKLDEDAF